MISNFARGFSIMADEIVDTISFRQMGNLVFSFASPDY